MGLHISQDFLSGGFHIQSVISRIKVAAVLCTGPVFIPDASQ